VIIAAWARLSDFPSGDAWSVGLSAAESARAKRFQLPERKLQYLAGHRLLRLAAGALLGIAPELVTLPAEGRPVFPDSERPLWLSLSHSGHFAVAAASDEGPIGVDVETADQERDWKKMAASLDWNGLDTATRKGFLRAWTLREAEFKAGIADGSVWRSDEGDFQLTVVSRTASPVSWLTPDAPRLYRA
jgi:phosphopantetheinyl transferase